MAPERTRRGDAAAVRRGPGTLEHAGGWNWRDRIAQAARGLGFADDDFERKLANVLGRRAHARLARALALGRSGPAPPRRADQPPRRPEPRVARTRARDARRGGDPRRPRPLVPRGGHHRPCSSSAPGRALLRRPVARVAAREGCARQPPRRRPAASRRTSPAWSASWPLPLQEVEGEAGAGEADADRPARGGARRRRAASSSRSPASGERSGSTSSSPPHRANRARSRRHLTLRRRQAPARRRHHRRSSAAEKVALVGPNGSGKTTLLEAILGGHPFDRGAAARPRRRPGVLLAAHAGAAHAGVRARRDDGRDRADAAAGTDAPRSLPLLRLGDARAHPSPRSRAASEDGSRSRSSSPRARTSSSSTSRRTTSTSRAERPSRPHSRRSRDGAPRLARPRAPGRRTGTASSPSRSARCARTTAVGPTSSASGARRGRRASPPEPVEQGPRASASPEAPARPSSSSSRRGSRRRRPGRRARGQARRRLDRHGRAHGPPGRTGRADRSFSAAGRCCSRSRRADAVTHAVAAAYRGHARGDPRRASPRRVSTPSFAVVAEELLDDVYGYLLYLTKNRAVAPRT